MSHRRRSRLAACGLAAALLLASGCGSSGSAGSGQSGGKKKVHLALQLLIANQAFSVETQAGAQAAADHYGATLDVNAPATFSPTSAQASVESSLTRGVDGIAIADEPAALWSHTLSDALSKTNGNVVAIQTPPSTDSGVKTYVGVDARELGVQTAKQAITTAGLGSDTRGDVLISTCNPQSTPLGITTAAIEKTAKSLLPQADVHQAFDSQLDPTHNAAAWLAAVQANPKVVLTLGSCDIDSDSMITAKQHTQGSFVIGTTDTDPVLLSAIKDGSAASTVAQNWYAEGYAAIRLLYQAAISGDKPPAGWIDPGTTVVTKANVDQIITRNASAAGLTAFYAPIVATLFADLKTSLQPLARVQSEK